MNIYLRFSLSLATCWALLSCEQQDESTHIVDDRISLSPIKAHGTSFVDASGDTIILRGVNLGNWFLLEPWMFGWFWASDQHTILQTLRTRFGEEQTAAMLAAHYETWITNEDFERIAGWGFNVVRLPFHYSIIENPENPGSLNYDGLKRIDAAIDMAARAGLYTILDFHGAPGGQSTDAPTGRVDQNLLWDSAPHQERFVNLWRELARHYRGNAAIAALDILNEPFGSGTEQNFEPILVDLFDRVYKAIRETGNESIILAPGTLRGMYFWPKPADRGWKQVGFTEHYYPGVFGGEPTLETHAQFFSYKVAGRDRMLQEYDAPFFVGEFNPVFNSAGGARMLQEHFDRYARHGWAATMWSYKMITPEGGIPSENWPLITNSSKLDPPDPRSADARDLHDFFAGRLFGETAVDQVFIDHFEKSKSEPLTLPGFLPKKFPNSDENNIPNGWTATALGFGTLPPVVTVSSSKQISIHGSGFDINANDDNAGYLWKKVQGDFTITSEISEFESNERWAKAGLMLRKSISHEDAMLLWNIFPDEPAAYMVRKSSGGKALEEKTQSQGTSMWLRITRENNKFILSDSNDGEEWIERGRVDDSFLPAEILVGFAVCSHDGHSYATAKLNQIEITQANP